MSQYLLIRQDTILKFKTDEARNHYQHAAKAKGETWMRVDEKLNTYTIYNPYIIGRHRISQRYNLSEVLSYVAAFE